MKTIGLTGGFGSGKSTVMDILKREHIPIIDTDEIARQLTEPGSPILERISERFGKDVLNADGSLNRKILARHVFDNSTALNDLNDIMHPAIRDIMRQQLDENQKAGVPWTVIDVPLLYECGWDEQMDATVLVWAPLDMCRARLIAQRGFTPEEINARIKSQWPIDEKRHRAHYVIDNSGDLRQTHEQVLHLLKKLEVDFPHAL